MIEQIESSIIAFLLGAVLTYFGARWSKILKKIDGLEYGVQALLRDRMLQMREYYAEKKKPIPQREVESFEAMYSAYHGLGGNGYIEDTRREIIEVMPHEVR